MYSALKVRELKEELKKRGASVRGKKADLIERLEYYDQNLNFGHAEIETDEPSIILPPHDTYRDINSDTKLPPINNTQISHYLCFTEKKFEAATSLYESRHLITARLSVVGDKTYVKGFCRKTMKSLQYEVDVKLDNYGNPEESHCECPAGSGLNAVCKHVAVMLLGLEHMVRDKVMLRYEVCTQKLQQFHVPTKQYTGTPVRAEKLPRKRKPGKIIFKPYPIEKLDKSNYNHRVRNLVLNFPNSNMLIKQLFEPANPYAMDQDHKYTNIDPQAEILKKLKLTKITTEEIELIQLETINQSSSMQWHQLRKIRLTASKFHTICHLKPSSLEKYAESYMDWQQISSRATTHGIINEKVAITKYCMENDLIILPCGLFIYKEKPYLAASPDGLLGNDTIIEVKCPYASRFQDINHLTVPYLELKNDILSLKKTTPYYYQIQGQLLCTNRQWCNLIIYTYKALKVVYVNRDEEFIRMMVQKLGDFFHNYLKQVIIQKYLYYNYDTYLK